MDLKFFLPQLLAVALFPSIAAAGSFEEVEVSGFLGVDTRFFTQDSQFPGQKGHAEISLIINPEFRVESKNGKHKFRFIPFARIDSRDSERSHFDIREAYWLWSTAEFEILTGFNRVFWGVTESRHLVNIINQADGVEDLDQEDYLGQPMINITTFQDFGQIDLFILPGFRERTFPGSEGRFRGPLVVDTDNPVYTSNLAQKHVDVALRYANYFGDWDVGVYYFYGTDREPRFILNNTATALLPVYDIIHQAGLDLQYTKGAMLYKFEGILQGGRGQTFGAFVAGGEYTFYQVGGSAADIGILFEYLHDGRNALQPPTAFEDDLFAGVRLALNDTQDTAVLAGAFYDPSSGETFINIEAERRLSQNLVVEFRARFFIGASPTDPTFALLKDDYIQFRLARYF